MTTFVETLSVREGCTLDSRSLGAPIGDPRGETSSDFIQMTRGPGNKRSQSQKGNENAKKPPPDAESGEEARPVSGCFLHV